MLRFLNSSSLKHERGSIFPLFEIKKLMYSAMRLLITVSSPDSASPSCRSPCNMCNLPSSHIFDSDVPELNASIHKAFSLTLRYVLRHWARNLLQSASAADHTDDLFYRLKDFLPNKLLFWMEAMNLLGAKFECSSLLKDAEYWLETVRMHKIYLQVELSQYIYRERSGRTSRGNWQMPRISRLSLQEALHRNQRHIYKYRHFLCGIRIPQPREFGGTGLRLFRQFHCQGVLSLYHC
jgi:hypothetical protein